MWETLTNFETSFCETILGDSEQVVADSEKLFWGAPTDPGENLWDSMRDFSERL